MKQKWHQGQKDYLSQYQEEMIWNQVCIKKLKEIDENSHSDDSYTGKLDLTNNRIDIFRQILDSKDNITIHIIKPNDIYLNIKNTSYLKIVSMSQIYPEDFLLFFNKEQRLYTPRELSLN